MRGLAVAWLWIGSGCSLFVVDGPPATRAVADQREQHARPACTTASNAPTIDAGVGLAILLVSAYGYLFAADGSNVDAAAGFAASGALPAAAFWISSRVGSGRIERCERYLETVSE